MSLLFQPPARGPLLGVPQNANASPQTLQLPKWKGERDCGKYKEHTPSFPWGHGLGGLPHPVLLFPLTPGCSGLRPREVAASLGGAQLPGRHALAPSLLPSPRCTVDAAPHDRKPALWLGESWEVDVVGPKSLGCGSR